MWASDVVPGRCQARLDSPDGFREPDLTDPNEPPQTSSDSSDSSPSSEDYPTRTSANDETLPASRGLTVGSRLDNYRLLSRLGVGGMGEVWEAEQIEPIKRRVAVKIIKRGMDSSTIVNRFQVERQALAMMDHPSIAKVYDAGTTPKGRPYFAMELVRGVRITEYCDKHRLTLQQRLRLFQQLCDAVQHAHQKAIIHRDLKPSNVLVSERDDEPHPTVIDFGVAKAMSQPLSEGTLFTQLGQMIGTVEYMSPEQAEMTGQGIDTRTDVYSLGVILYELIVGVLPFDRDELREAGFGGVQRILREKEPQRPSTRVSSIAADSSSKVASARRAETTTLVRNLRGDLDWIVLKALEKERSRRYQTPRDLAADIERHLTLQPIEARPASTAYRVSRFVKRNRLLVTMGGALLLLLVGFAATMTLQARRIAAERDRANEEAQVSGEISRFLTELFEVSDPSEARGNSVTAREILDRGAERIESELSDQPEVQARLMSSIGGVYQSLGLFDDADRLLERAWQQQVEILGEDDSETISTLMSWTDVLYRQGRYKEVLPYSEQIVEQRRRVLGERHPDTLDALAGYASVLTDLGRIEEARTIDTEVLELTREIYGEDSSEYFGALYNLEVLYLFEGRSAEAIPGFEKIVAGYTKHEGADARITLTAKSMLGMAYQGVGNLERAEPLLREVLVGREKILGKEHDGTLMSVGNLAVLLSEMGDHEEAETMLAELVDIRRRGSGPNNPWTASALEQHGSVLSELGRYEEAEGLMREALEINREVYDPIHSDVLGNVSNLAEVLERRGLVTEAERLVSRSLSDVRQGQLTTTAAADALRVHASLLLQLDRASDALEALDSALTVLDEKTPESAGRAEALELKARALNALGRPEDASAAQSTADQIRRALDS